MIVIPAIDIRNGKCVRLTHGREDKETIYSDDPVAIAKKWKEAGANRLHVIDLDGAFSGEPKNLDIVLRIKKETGTMVQMGGGLRTMESINKVLKAGIDRIILGTVVVEEAGLAKSAFESYADRIMVALDVNNDMVAVRGWKNNSEFPVKEALSIVDKLGGREVIYTDISRDGTLGGVNLKSVCELMQSTDLKIYASGGISSIDDIIHLKTLGTPGCIVGKALYEGKLNLVKAIQMAR